VSCCTTLKKIFVVSKDRKGIKILTYMQHPLNSLTTEEQVFLDDLRISPKQSTEISNYEQKSSAWLKSRQGRLTGSNFGAAVCHNPYKSRKELLIDLLWRTFKGNEATEYGTRNEPVACEAYRKFLENTVKTRVQRMFTKKFMISSASLREYMWKYFHTPNETVQIRHPGLMISPERFYLGVSPDGIVCVPFLYGALLEFLLEIKCPFSMKSQLSFYDHCIPVYYYDQIQGTMGLQTLPFCHFVIWTPSHTRIAQYNFDVNYWISYLSPQLDFFYFNYYLPNMLLKRQGKLIPGSLTQADNTVGTETSNNSSPDASTSNASNPTHDQQENIYTDFR
jgi:hypothetical protein